ncbi:hypothetical protein HAX54_025797 [Datura stramonium]|uniref:Uncharacterized protein n=1 Tax=Datura stramonium TaxID=4076 RepID=A0ABS8V018_DATST|nr:hypothetical protein [Datura stramonium]
MAVNSVANVPQLLYANGQSPKILAGSKDGVFVDFVGMYCKSSKRRRRIGYAAANRRSFINNKLNAINAVLDLERVASNASQQSSDIVPKMYCTLKPSPPRLRLPDPVLNLPRDGEPLDCKERRSLGHLPRLSDPPCFTRQMFFLTLYPSQFTARTHQKTSILLQYLFHHDCFEMLLMK